MLAQLRRDTHRRKGRGPLGGLARRFLLASLAPVALGAFVAQGGGAPPWAPGPTIAIRVPDPAHPSNDRRDSDCDGLSDAEEFAVAPAGTGTDPADWDSDDDGLADGVELGRVASLDLACSTTWVDLDPTTRSDPRSYDSDDDGLADGLEDRNRNGRVDDGESDPRAVDTDGDGLPDGVEDRNRNGRLDPGETSPSRADTDRDGHRDGAERVRGTDPTRPDALVFPEPLVYDLVRGLGAHRGEFEVNTLAQFSLRRDLGGPLWAPELEYAFAEGYAVELELPMEGGRLHAFKLGVQGTFGQSRRIGALHGWQGLAEYVPAEKGWLGSLTHVGALRFNPRWSALTIVGAQYDRNPVADERALRFLANASAFAEASARLTWGLEGNLRVGGPGRVDWQVTPQAHVQLWPKWRLQLGFGAGGHEGRANLIGATRLVAEL